ncbi:unnamed protein product, partial [marine sediment metagenome]
EDVEDEFDILGLLASRGIVEPVDYEEMWQGMPEFEQEDKTEIKSIKINFATQEDIDRFSELIGQNITEKTRSIWYPEQEISSYVKVRFTDE